MNTTSVSINEAALSYRPYITVSAESTVELVQRDGGCNTYASLLVDGRYHDLIMVKHLSGRPEAEAALQTALKAVQDAIDALNPPAPEPTRAAELTETCNRRASSGGYKKEIRYDRETKDYAMYLDGELVGFAHTYHDAEITLDQLVFERFAANGSGGSAKLMLNELCD